MTTRRTHTARRSAAALLLLLGGLLAAAPGRAQERPVPPPGTQILTADEIARAGLTRLTDLFRLAEHWFATSLDGYTWQATAGGLAPAQTPAWTVMVDGLLLDVSLWETVNLNLLPVSLAEIDYVELTHVPVLAGGVYARGGLLHIHTRTPAPGLTLYGGLAAGNEVDDPGPFAYTPYATPNIDRIGPHYAAGAGLATRRSFARLSVKGDEYHVTDARLYDRHFALYTLDAKPRLTLAAPALMLGTEGPRGRHRLLAGYTRLHDQLFVAPLGLEVPATHRLYHAGAAGTVTPGPGGGLHYRVGFVSYDLDPRPNRRDVDLDWRQDRLRASVEGRFGGPGGAGVQGAVGAGVDYYLTLTTFPLQDPSLLVTRAYGRLDWQPGTRWRQQVGLHLTHTYDRLGVKALAAVTLRPGRAHTLALTAAFARQTLEEENSLWYWTTQGYRFVRPDTLALGRLPFLPLSSTLTVDLGWTFRPTGAFSLTAEGGYRRFFQHALADYTFAYDPATDGFTPTTRLVTGLAGQVLHAGLGVGLRQGTYLSHRLFYRFTRPASPDVVFWRTWRGHPWHQAGYTAAFTPNDRLSLYGRLRYQPPTEWPAFFPAAAASDYPARLPARLDLDLSVQKRFWRDHLRAGFSLRNLLNRPTRHHPAGDVSHLTFTFDLQVNWHTAGW